MPLALPFIDEIETTVAAPPGDVFLALARRLSQTFGGVLGRSCTALIGCAHRGTDFTVPPLVGQEVNGFRVARVAAPREMILEGRHRFATYQLSFFIEPLDDGGSKLRARTHADFPGVAGSMYRALVIGSGAHAAVVRRMLTVVAMGAGSKRDESGHRGQ